MIEISAVQKAVNEFVSPGTFEEFVQKWENDFFQEENREIDSVSSASKFHGTQSKAFRKAVVNSLVEAVLDALNGESQPSNDIERELVHSISHLYCVNAVRSLPKNHPIIPKLMERLGYHSAQVQLYRLALDERAWIEERKIYRASFKE